MRFDVPTFHLTDGLYFQRQPDNSVRIIKTETGQDDAPVVFDLTVDASQWASVIASMSYLGEENGGFYHALHFHRGDPIPDAYKWRFTGAASGYDPAIHDNHEWPHPGPFPSRPNPVEPPASDGEPCDRGHNNPNLRDKDAELLRTAK